MSLGERGRICLNPRPRVPDTSKSPDERDTAAERLRESLSKRGQSS
jgi:hypothetical protein